MPKFILKLQHEDKSFYLEWSTVVDAPVTHGMSLDEFTEYYRAQYGEQGMYSLPDRLKRVEENGTSSKLGDTAEDLIAFNRAGPNETCLTQEEIIKDYCLEKTA